VNGLQRACPGKPFRALLLAGITALAMLGPWVSLKLATDTPWMGLTLQASEPGDGLQVLGRQGPAQQLPAASRILALRSAAEPAMALQPDDLLEEPDYLNDYAPYNAFFERQSQLHQRLRSPGLELQLADGSWTGIEPAAQRPWTDLPTLFWLQLLFALAALAAGAIVLALRTHAGAWWYLGTSLGLALTCATAAIYSSRELAMDGVLFHRLSMLNHFGGLMFTGCAVAMMWAYPRPLGSLRIAALFPLLFLGIWSLHASQQLVNHDLGFRLPITLSLLLFCYLAWRQWRQAVDQPADRAALKWFLFSWVAGSSLFVITLFIPLLTGVGPLIPQGYVFGLLIACYLCMPLGLTRYQLFNLNRWWFNAWAWFFAACAVVLLHGLLGRMHWLPADPTLLAALAIVGWLFFPLQRMAWHSLAAPRRETRARRYAEAAQLMLELTPETLPAAFWRRLLQTAFGPLQIADTPTPITTAQLLDEGNALAVPGADGAPALMLRGAELGRRLFDPEDLKTAHTLGGLFQQALSAHRAYARGAEAERERLRRELHEDIGARLLNQLHSSDTPAGAAASRALLEEIRSLIDLLDHRAFLLDECLNEWRAQFEEHCETLGLPCSVEMPQRLPAVRLTAVEHSHPPRILREAVSNAKRHSQPTHCWLTIELQPDGLLLTCRHDGQTHPVAGWRAARGIRNMRMRAQDLRGSLNWSEPAIGQVSMELRFPLTHGVAA
jgi:signal transduction histidine kinase